MCYEVKIINVNDDYDYRAKLQIIYKNEVLAEYYDGGEPEDNYFFRDWGWIAHQLNKAYNLGLQDGKC